MNPLLISAARQRLKNIRRVYPNSGPGAIELIAGDDSVGWLGEVTTGSLITGAALISRLGGGLGTGVNSSSPWLKFVHNGKVLFVASRPYSRQVSWSMLNSKDILTGARTLVIGEHTYKVRVLTGGNANPASVAGGEWDALMYAVSEGRPSEYVGLKAANYSDSALGVGTSSNPIRTICMETMANNAANGLNRGRVGVQWFGGLVKSDDGTLVYWRPVLELVE